MVNFNCTVSEGKLTLVPVLKYSHNDL